MMPSADRMVTPVVDMKAITDASRRPAEESNAKNCVGLIEPGARSSGRNNEATTATVNATPTAAAERGRKRAETSARFLADARKRLKFSDGIESIRYVFKSIKTVSYIRDIQIYKVSR